MPSGRPWTSSSRCRPPGLILHCHIAEHLSAGMMSALRLSGSESRERARMLRVPGRASHTRPFLPKRSIGGMRRHLSRLISQGPAFLLVVGRHCHTLQTFPSTLRLI